MRAHLDQFYRANLEGAEIRDSVLTAVCPFCSGKQTEKQARITVFLNPASFFYGYFRCSRSCVDGGFQYWFAKLLGIDPASVPGEVIDEPLWHDYAYPQRNINVEIDDFHNKLSQDQLSFFEEAAVPEAVLRQLRIGFNGRYLVYPYIQPNGNCYSARCVHPEDNDDYFWYGDTDFAAGQTGLFNVEEIERCAGGTIFLCEGEENLLMIKKLGFPGVAFFERALLEEVDPQLFGAVKTVFMVMRNSAESYASARMAAAEIGFKVRILKWPAQYARDYSLRQFGIDTGKDFGKKFGEMLTAAKPFSPFSTPQKEYQQFQAGLIERAGVEYSDLLSGFDLLDERIEGIHGINILGGGPKVGKSSFMIQIATSMASRAIPVLYYDFENGRQRIYQRTFSRLARLDTSRLHGEDLLEEEQVRHDNASEELAKMLRYFRVVNDRKLSPELMRRHIDFLRHETRSEYTVVVIDSLHKLPFKDLAERRSGIDAWLRQMESIRDDMNVAFLVVSELTRGQQGGYDEQPHMGLFKGSGDIEYSADNAMVLLPGWDHMTAVMTDRVNKLWLVASREHSPGLVARYCLDYPYWGFIEEDPDI